MAAHLIQQSHREHVVREAADIDALRAWVEQALDPGVDAAPVRRVATRLGNALLDDARRGGHVYARRLLPEDTGAGGAIELIAVCGGALSSTPDLASLQHDVEAFDVFATGAGDALIVRCGAPTVTLPGDLQVGGLSLPCDRAEPNGDGWAIYRSSSEVALLVVDGLGHGRGAAEATAMALKTFQDVYRGDPLAFAIEANRALRPTRGAALALVRIGAGASALQYLGVGNVEARLEGDGVGARGLASLPGTIGMSITPPKMRLLEYPWTPASRLIVHSDGVSNRFDLADWPGLLRRDPGLVAAVIHRARRRPDDDATIVCLRADGAASG